MRPIVTTPPAHEGRPLHRLELQLDAERVTESLAQILAELCPLWADIECEADRREIFAIGEASVGQSGTGRFDILGRPAALVASDNPVWNQGLRGRTEP